MSTPHRSSRLRRRGTASLEAIVMLPFFIFMFASVYLMHAHYSGRQQAMLTARTCLWKFAAGGCKEEDRSEFDLCLTPNGAQGKETVLIPDTAPPDPKRHENLNTEIGDVLSAIENIPIVGPAVRWLFGKPMSATALQIVQLPAFALPQKERYIAAGQYHTMCNSAPMGWKDLATSIFCSFVGEGSLGC